MTDLQLQIWLADHPKPSYINYHDDLERLEKQVDALTGGSHYDVIFQTMKIFNRLKMNYKLYGDSEWLMPKFEELESRLRGLL